MEKKPWYKKWWVILLIVIAVFAAIPTEEETASAEATDENSATSEVAEESTEEKAADSEVEEKAADSEAEKSTKNEKIDLVINSVEERTLTSAESMMATDGNIVMDVNITITNNSIEEGLNMNPLYFEAETETLSGITTSIFINDENAPDAGADIKEGASKDYTLTFEIPADEEILSITYDNLFQSVTTEV